MVLFNFLFKVFWNVLGFLLIFVFILNDMLVKMWNYCCGLWGYNCKMCGGFGKILKIVIFLCCVIGILLFVYVLYVEIYVENDKNYRVSCDISVMISCLKVFKLR